MRRNLGEQRNSRLAGPPAHAAHVYQALLDATHAIAVDAMSALLRHSDSDPPSPPLQPPAPLSFEHTRPFLHAWFEREAEQREVARDELHRLSGWSYLSTAEFRSLVADAVHRLNPPIRDGAFIYELGIGAGAVLKTISSLHRIRPAGCDFSPKAIQRASEIFPAHAAAFRVGDIALPLSSKGGCAARAGAYSHVLSFGSLAMYLTHSEMAVALRNVAKLASAGGSVAVTHFIEADGEPKGTIVAPISRQRLRQLASAAGLTNISFHPMKYQGDRFMMTARGPRVDKSGWAGGPSPHTLPPRPTR